MYACMHVCMYAYLLQDLVCMPHTQVMLNTVTRRKDVFIKNERPSYDFDQGTAPSSWWLELMIGVDDWSYSNITLLVYISVLFARS